jgi:hypothetical protein
VLLALFRPVEGSFNLAAEPAMSFRDMQRLLHRRPIPVPLPVLDWVHRGLWHLAGLGGEPGWLKGMRHPPILTASVHFGTGLAAEVFVRDCFECHLNPIILKRFRPVWVGVAGPPG